MKKLYKGLIVGAAALGLLAFTGCEDLLNLLEETSLDKGYEIVKATESDEYNYDELEGTKKIIEVYPYTKSVTINDIPAGKTMYLVKRNTSDKVAIAASDTRAVMSGYYSRSAAGITDISDIEVPESKFKHFVPEKIDISKTDISRSVLSSVEPSYSVTPVTRTVGTKKDIWVELSSGYVKKSATLRAVGDYCNVWVVDDYYAIKKGDNKVDSSVATDYKNKFDTMYPLIRYVFGNESEKIYDTKNSKWVSISSISDTGDKVNIVIYDIKQAYVLGFFYSKDYYYGPEHSQDIIRKSNLGKYFYVDSELAVSDFDNTISTLAHEFQHMINFNQKNLNPECDETPSTAYGEMLSMLCEDMMQKYLGLADEYSPKNRIQSFNAYYYNAGINGYNDTKDTLLYYSTNYVFGSWLARQYGGAKFVSAMSKNNYVDEESIENAAGKDFEDLFMEFLLALTGSSTYTHNKNAAQSMTYSGYSYPMAAFNIFDKEYGIGIDNFPDKLKYLKSSKEDWRGPFNFDPLIGYELKEDNGITIHNLGTTVQGSRTLTFLDGADCLAMYVIIQ